MKLTINGKTYKIRGRFLKKCDWFLQSKDSKRLAPIPLDPGGHSAIECFFAHETLGLDLPCCQPAKLAALFNGKEWHGVTVEMVAADLLGCLVTRQEVLRDYPEWVAKEITAQAQKLACATLGFSPQFLTRQCHKFPCEFPISFRNLP